MRTVYLFFKFMGRIFIYLPLPLCIWVIVTTAIDCPSDGWRTWWASMIIPAGIVGGYVMVGIWGLWRWLCNKYENEENHL